MLNDHIKKHNTEIESRLDAQLSMSNKVNDLLAMVFRKPKTFLKLDCNKSISEISSDLFFKHPLWDTDTYQTHQ